MSMAEIFAIAAGAALLGLGIGYAVRTLYFLRGRRLVKCPETGATVAVDLDVKYSAVHSAFGTPHFRLKDCTRWPEKAGCGQMCLGDLEAAPEGCLARTIVARWYEGKQCAFCQRGFGAIHWHDHTPALVDAQGVTRQWTELPADKLPELLASHRPVCWNCHVAESFRRVHPDLVIERPLPPPPMI